jgi:hypothetical protein
MRVIPLRRLLSKLTVLALSASSATAGAAPPISEVAAELDRDLDEDLPIDREHVDVEDAALVLARGLAQALSEMRQLDAIHLATSWALSADPLRRAAVARSLEWQFQLLPDGIILDHLSRDPDPQIRGACARAAWIRRASGVDPAILNRLATDPDPEVRAIAVRAW